MCSKCWLTWQTNRHYIYMSTWETDFNAILYQSEYILNRIIQRHCKVYHIRFHDISLLCYSEKESLNTENQTVLHFFAGLQFCYLLQLQKWVTRSTNLSLATKTLFCGCLAGKGCTIFSWTCIFALCNFLLSWSCSLNWKFHHVLTDHIENNLMVLLKLIF